MPLRYRTPDLIAYQRGEAQLTTKSDVFQLGLVLAELFTGKNPAKAPKDEGDELVLDRVGYVPGEHGGLIWTLITEMLERDWDKRPDAGTAFDKWADRVLQYCGSCPPVLWEGHLRVFCPRRSGLPLAPRPHRYQRREGRSHRGWSS